MNLHSKLALLGPLAVCQALLLTVSIPGQSGSCVQVKFMTYNVQAPGWNPNRRAASSSNTWSIT